MTSLSQSLRTIVSVVDYFSGRQIVTEATVNDAWHIELKE